MEKPAVLVTFLALSLYVSVTGGDISCPAPRSPDNGQSFISNNGQVVTYRCNPGFRMKGSDRSICVNNEWTTKPPECVDSIEVTSEDDGADLQDTSSSRPLFSWGDSDSKDNSSDSTELQADESNVRLLMYPLHRRSRVSQGRYWVSPKNTTSRPQTQEEQRRRRMELSRKDRMSERESYQPSRTAYLRVPLYSPTQNKVISEDALRRQYEIAAYLRREEERSRMEEEKESKSEEDDSQSKPFVRAAVYGKNDQYENSLRHMYAMAEIRRLQEAASQGQQVTSVLLPSSGAYSRLAMSPLSAIHPNDVVVLNLSESQMAWINSLYPELRERYLKDLYTNRVKEAAESARAQDFLRRYQDVYRYYVDPESRSAPLIMYDPDETSTFDYSCMRTDANNRGRLIPAPKLPNTYIVRYDRLRHNNPPYNHYLAVQYNCNAGYVFDDRRIDRLYCRRGQWIGHLPRCIVRGK